MPDETAEAPVEGPRPVPSPEVPPPAEPAEDWATRYKYLQADFENFRRRTERERESVTRQARAGLIRELLPLIEAFRSAREAATGLPPKDPLRHGLELLDREWTTFLKHEGVVPIAVVGEAFQPEEEEAVGEAPPPARVPEGAVVEIVQQGYRFFGGILRPAKVIVARTPPDSESTLARREEPP